ncbi:MAG TPA: FG-GAP-like repeat-containing protein, partial [Cyclobacteriaceae bacterium]|nr:FG-GAP-like repeat-containing protein [Cyclobacteriaceae bacterium]
FVQYLFCLSLLQAINLNAQVNFQEITQGNPVFISSHARGIAIADYDNDGLDDIFVCNPRLEEPNRLYRNLGNFQFADVTASAGLLLSNRTKMAVWFDADNDGWLDLYLGDLDNNQYFRNNGDGTFTEITTSSGLASSSSPGALLVGDLNGDGWPDVYASNFNKLNHLFLNKSKHEFANKIIGSGAERSSFAMGAVLLDYDNDGDLDIYLTYDNKVANVLFENDGKGKFKDVARDLGLDYKGFGMGVDIADFNRDGIYDLYITNLFDNALLQSLADGKYEDIAVLSQTNDYGMGWGVLCFDYDNDGFTDIYVVNEYGFSPYPNKLYKNNGDGTFSDVTANSALELKFSGYGVATADFDGDGKPDLAVANSSGVGLKIFKNNEADGKWIQLNLVGKASNKFAIGARVELRLAGDIILMKDVTVGSGYTSQNAYRIHIGLGEASDIEQMIIHWPSGHKDIYETINVNQRLLAIESEALEVFDLAKYRAALLTENLLPQPEEIIPDPTDFVNDKSMARVWMEALLSAISNDLARPTVHARNLFHISAAMYDAWAAFDEQRANYFLGNTIAGFSFPFEGIKAPEDLDAARNEAISYAAYRLIHHRFKNSPGYELISGQTNRLFDILGYNAALASSNFSNGEPYALGNYIAAKVIEFGLQDGSNEANGYANLYYQPVNPPLKPELPGNPDFVDLNRWQPLSLQVFIDQSGNVQQSTPPFLSPEWGNLVPFALKETDLKLFQRGGHTYRVYHDPGHPPYLNMQTEDEASEIFKWNFALVSIWASHLDDEDGVMIDISPASIGNIESYPTNFKDHQDFYDLFEGGETSLGYTLNPKTNQPYASQMVPRGDYTRVLAEYWADGPQSVTPPGHWYEILHYVSDHPSFKRKWQGEGNELDVLEWDVKAYLTMGGAMHDVAISAWGIKGYYDYARPITAIRGMAQLGQSSNPDLPHYHVAGLPLIPDYIELVEADDELAGANQEHVGKIKL